MMSDSKEMQEYPDNLHQELVAAQSFKIEDGYTDLYLEVTAFRTFAAQVDNYFDGRPLGPEGVKIMMAMNHFLSLLGRALDEEITLVEQWDCGTELPNC